MDAKKLHFAEPPQLEEIKIVTNTLSKKQAGGDSWLTSYADVVTVLLCFFIIFYMIEKQHDKNYGFGPHSGTAQAYKTKMKAPLVRSLIETLNVLPQVIVSNKDQFLEVHFPPKMFFASGSTKLTANGMKVINALIKPLIKIESGYILQIQGYTDSSSVRDIEKRWWKNNMELSIERSLSVYDYLLSRGVSAQILAVTGFGANRPRFDTSNNLSSDEIQRRISFKFEPVLQTNEE